MANTKANIMSGMTSGSNSDLWSQSGGRASTFQSTNGSGGLKAKPNTGGRSRGKGGWIPGSTYSIFGPGGDASNNKSGNRNVPGVALNLGGNSGPTMVTRVVYPKVLGPKGFGGNYKLSKGY